MCFPQKAKRDRGAVRLHIGTWNTSRFFQAGAFLFTARPSAAHSRRFPAPMNPLLLLPSINLLPSLFAQSAAAAPASWHAGSLAEALVYTAIFSLAGTFLAIIGYKLFDYCTPGNLHEEIVKNRNPAAALIGAAVIVGVCIVVAASIVG